METGSFSIENINYQLSPLPCRPGEKIWGAKVTFDGDISGVMPYLNGCLKRCFYMPKSRELTFDFLGCWVSLRPNEIRIANIPDREEAGKIVEKLVRFMESIWKRRKRLKPNLLERKPPDIMEVLRLLPKTNCGACGEATCLAFAAKVSRGEADLKMCKPLMEKPSSPELEKAKDMGIL